MEKKTIGQFIAALRKANGLTQQEVADRLAVSNKAVSRWERDECAPDISVIPALAELLGVTCDELLRGERITNAVKAERSEPKIEKQVKTLINRTLSGFKTLIWISLAVAFVGLVCMFGISYGFYRPVIGFAVMLLFEACAFAIAVLAVNRTKDVKTDNELFESADEALVQKYNDCLGIWSFHAFFAIFAVAVVSLPLVLFTSDYVESVLAIESYITMCLGGAVLVLAFVYLKTKTPYIAWVTDTNVTTISLSEEEKLDDVKMLIRKMNLVQIGGVLLASVLLFVLPYFDTDRLQTTPLYTAVAILALVCMAITIVYFVVCMVKEKYHRKSLCIVGIRNILLLPAPCMISYVHSISWWNDAGSTEWVPYEHWDMEYLWLALGWALLVFVVFGIVEAIMKKH